MLPDRARADIDHSGLGLVDGLKVIDTCTVTVNGEWTGTAIGFERRRRRKQRLGHAKSQLFAGAVDAHGPDLSLIEVQNLLAVFAPYWLTAIAGDLPPQALT